MTEPVMMGAKSPGLMVLSQSWCKAASILHTMTPSEFSTERGGGPLHSAMDLLTHDSKASSRPAALMNFGPI